MTMAAFFSLPLKKKLLIFFNEFGVWSLHFFADCSGIFQSEF
jgi:hypothetical protein